MVDGSKGPYWRGRLLAPADLRKLVAGRGEEAVPVFAGKGHVGAGSALADAFGLGGAEDDLDVRRVAGDPGDGDAGRCNALHGGDLVDGVVERAISLAVAEEDAVEPALLERRPGLQRDLI